MIKIAAVYVLFPVPLQGFLYAVPPACVSVQHEINLRVLLHQWAAFFKEGQRIEDKTICQWGYLIPVNGAEREKIKEAFKDGNMFRFVVYNSYILRGTAAFETAAAQFIAAGIIGKADGLLLFPIQKKVHLLAETGSNFRGDAPALKIIEQRFVVQLPAGKDNNFPAVSLFLFTSKG